MSSILTAIVIVAWEYFLGSTKTIDANSTAELAVEIAQKLYKKLEG